MKLRFLLGILVLALPACGGNDAADAPDGVQSTDQADVSCTVQGAIRAEYDALGGASSVLGGCTTSELGTPDGIGRYNHFQRGSIYWTPATGAHEVHGAIRDKWASLGWETSALGYPTHDEMDVPGGRQSDFQNGAISWNATTQEVVVHVAGDPEVCTIPAGADPRIHAAVARPGVRCTRYPFPLAAPRAVLETRDGNIFVTELGAGRVLRLTPSGFVAVAQGLAAPIGLAEDPSGALLVTEEKAHSLSRIDPVTGARTELTSSLDNATYVTVGADGAAYVSSFTGFDPSGRVVRVALDGSAASSVVAAGLSVPEGLFFGADGRLVVAEWNRAPARVVRFPLAGGDVSLADTVTSDLEHVYGTIAAADGGIDVADTADRVLHVAPNGQRVLLLSNVAVPAGLARTASGDLLVIELADLGFSKMGYLLRLSTN